MPFLIYGANGYTGELIAREAVRRGLVPTLAGRNAAALGALAKELGLPARAFGLDDPAAVAAGLAGMTAVLHCAGPFARTAAPMVAACLAARVHYLDITGELGVFEALAARDAAAKKAGVLLLPGVGFDVVPSDCLAAHLKRRLPGAVRLALGFQASGGISHGTATTMIENLGAGGAVRRGGVITPVPSAWKTRTIDFGRGPRQAVTIPWGDVSTAFYSTGIPDIEVYLAAKWGLRAGLRLSRTLRGALGSAPVQRFLKRRIDAGPKGPSATERARGRSLLWGEVVDASGATAVSRLSGPEGYDFTVATALEIVQRVLARPVAGGFQTPSRAFGPDLVMAVPGVERVDL